MQLATGRNGTVPNSSELPSAGFSPARNIFAINALFGPSLAFAIISSFLAVLGRQWLVYYRKRSGGGRDRQRWEQLKRLLGAQRWRMELILDDVLPSFLQTGLIIFCTSLVMYLHHLSPAISIIVGIPLYLGFAFFLVSALCTLWDRFCPFHSPLSHLICSSAHKVPVMVTRVNEELGPYAGALRKLGRQLVKKLTRRTGSFLSSSAFRESTTESSTTEDVSGSGPQDLAPSKPDKHWLQTLRHGRQEETLESLQVIVLRRAICTSDDPMTLLYATANIIGITNEAHLEQLWGDNVFQERLLKLVKNSYTRRLQLRSTGLGDTAAYIRRIYCAAVAHITLTLNFEWDWRSALCQEMMENRQPTAMLPSKELASATTPLIQTTLAFAIFQWAPSHSPEYRRDIYDRLGKYSDTLARNDWRLLCLIAWVASHLPGIFVMDYDVVPSLRLAYKGFVSDRLITLCSWPHLAPYFL